MESRVSFKLMIFIFQPWRLVSSLAMCYLVLSDFFVSTLSNRIRNRKYGSMFGKEFGTAVSNTCSLAPLRILGHGSSSDTLRIQLGILYREYRLVLTSFSRKFVRISDVWWQP